MSRVSERKIVPMRSTPMRCQDGLAHVRESSETVKGTLPSTAAAAGCEALSPVASPGKGRWMSSAALRRLTRGEPPCSCALMSLPGLRLGDTEEGRGGCRLTDYTGASSSHTRRRGVRRGHSTHSPLPKEWDMGAAGKRRCPCLSWDDTGWLPSHNRWDRFSFTDVLKKRFDHFWQVTKY